jgi:adenylate cyclase
MQISMKKRWRQWVICALIAICSAAGARLLSNFRFFQLLNLKALDAHFLLRGRQPTSNIILVTGDQKALDTFPELRVFWHPYYAQAIHAVGEAGASVIGLDLAFGVPVEKWEPDYDRMLSEAVSTSPAPVVCGYVSSLNTNQQTLAVPINMLAAALGLSGFANLTIDADEFVRSQELIERPQSNSDSALLARSFAFRVAEKYLGSDAEMRDGRLTLAGHEIPILQDRTIWINYAGPSDTFPRVSLADVVAASRAGRKDQLREWFHGKIALVGADAADDRYPTPFYTLVSGRHWLTAGVEIHANTIRTILERKYLLRVPEWARETALLGATAITAGIVMSAAAGPASLLLLLQGLAVLALTHLLFRAGWMLSTSEILAAAIFSLVAAAGYRFSTAEKRSNLFHKAISLFVGKELAASLEISQAIRLSGKSQMVTILFTDIRGFTAFSEQVCDTLGPQAVVEMLNEYMALMVPIIVKYKGQVNKFIGDGILAIFSDDDEGAAPGDHPLRAVRCATEMVTEPSQFQTGAGLHTGIAVVGNVGSTDKMEYTVLGDTVNLASRLESLNKEHKTRLLMSETTRSLLRDHVPTTHLGAVAVKGKTLPIDLYTVTSLVVSHEVVNV